MEVFTLKLRAKHVRVMAAFLAINVAGCTPSSDSGVATASSSTVSLTTIPVITTITTLTKVVGLFEIMESGSLTIESITGGSELQLRLKPQGIYIPIRVTIPAGIVFRNSRGGQVIGFGGVASIPSGIPVTASIGSLPLDGGIQWPGGPYEMVGPADGDLGKLFMSRVTSASFRLQMYAIWTVRFNPTRRGYDCIGTLGPGSALCPTEEDFEQIRSFFVETGINPSSYRAFQ